MGEAGIWWGVGSYCLARQWKARECRDLSFHDSRGVEAGSATELSTVQRMCLPLDDCRELFENERDIFRLLKGTAPVFVIFTKQDGAVSKETSQLLMDFPENTRNRGMLITLDAVHLFDWANNQDITIVVWGRNMLKRVDSGVCIGGVKLGSGVPSMWNLIQHICSNMFRRFYDYDNDSHHDRRDYFRRNHYYDDNDDVSLPFAIGLLPLLTGPPLHLRSFQPDVLTLVSPTVKDWIQTVASFIEDNKVPLHEKAKTLLLR
ncbi:hypothetical protein B0H14DRAFT_2615537 [Mycena olivaceomarginata]|nr:hypothetical protein B0H14DRAFT_2615537 [Mycena olivaceomarginata]